MKPNMRRIALILLGAVFIASALLKLHSIARFELYLFGFGLLSFDLCTLAARLLIAGELLLGVALAVEFRPRLLCRIGLGVTVLFSLWLAWLAIAGREDNCHCFGEALALNPVQSLVKNGVLAVGLLWAGAQNGGRKYPSCVPLIAAMLLVAGVFLLAPKPALFRRFKQGTVNPTCTAFLAEQLPEGRRVAVFYGTDCSFCNMTAAKIAAICRRHGIRPERLHAFFMRTHKGMEGPVADFFAWAGAELHPWNEVDLLEFLALTNGSFPLIVLTDEGRVEEVFDYNSLDERRVSSFLDR